MSIHRLSALPATPAPGARRSAPSLLAQRAVFVFVEDFLMSCAHIFCQKSRQRRLICLPCSVSLSENQRIASKIFLMLTKRVVYAYVQEVSPPQGHPLCQAGMPEACSLQKESPFPDLTTKRVHRGHRAKQQHISLSSVFAACPVSPL